MRGESFVANNLQVSENGRSVGGAFRGAWSPRAWSLEPGAWSLEPYTRRLPLHFPFSKKIQAWELIFGLLMSKEPVKDVPEEVLLPKVAWITIFAFIMC